MGQFTELFQDALQVSIITAQNLLAPGILVDEGGQPLQCLTQAEYSTQRVAPTICYVGLELGPISFTKNIGVAVLDDTGTEEVHLYRADESKVTWSFYTDLEPQRRYLVDYFIWNLTTGYAVVNNVRINAYAFEVFRNSGIDPYQEQTFSVEYPPAELGEDRPYGLPFKSVLKMRCTIQTSYGVPFSPVQQAILNLSPFNPPGNLGGPTAITFS